MTTQTVDLRVITTTSCTEEEGEKRLNFHLYSRSLLRKEAHVKAKMTRTRQHATPKCTFNIASVVSCGEIWSGERKKLDKTREKVKSMEGRAKCQEHFSYFFLVDYSWHVLLHYLCSCFIEKTKQESLSFLTFFLSWHIKRFQLSLYSSRT